MQIVDLVYRVIESIGFTDPIHPPVTHLPIGLIVGAFALGLISLLYHRTVAGRAARYCAIIALLSLFITAVFGYLDWQHFYAGGWLRPIKYKLVLAAVLLVLLVSAVISGRRREQTSGSVMLLYSLSLATALGLGYFGGQLVYSERTPHGANEFQTGEALFRGNCSGCHPYGANIAAPAHPLRGAAELRDFGVFLRWIRDPRLPNGDRGAMPPFRPSRITDEQAKAIHHYVSAVMGSAAMENEEQVALPQVVVRTDTASIGKGRTLFEGSCVLCHTARSTETKVGPSLKGILKRERLPVSRRPATPENVYRQLRRPYENMPSFADSLSDNDVFNLIAYLNTR